MSEERDGQRDAGPDPEDLDLDTEIDETADEAGDAESDAADLDPDAGDGADVGGPAARPEAKPPTRAERRFQKLSNDLRTEREARIRLEGQVQGRQPAQQPIVDRAAEDREFAERIRLLAPEEAAMAVGQRVEQRTYQALMQQELRIGDTLDRQSFAQLMRDEPAARRLSDQIEAVLAAERQAGRNPTRETVYTYLAGKELRDRSGRAAAQQRRTGQARIAAQTTKPGNSRSTATPTGARRSGGDSEREIEERWGDTPL